MKKIILAFFTFMILILSSCHSGSCNTQSNNGVDLGVLPNGSTVYVDKTDAAITSSTAQTATISLVGGEANTSYTMNLTSEKLLGGEVQARAAKHDSKSDSLTNFDANGISITPILCEVGTTGSGKSSSCVVTIAVSTDAQNGTYNIIPRVVSNQTGVVTTLTPFVVLVRGNTPTPPVPPTPAATISAYSILGNAGVILGNDITVTVPDGTNLSALVATFTATTGATLTVGDTTQISGETVNNFTSPIIYTVTNGDVTSTYTVTVLIAPNPLAAIESYSILGESGAISGNNIAVNLPYGTNVESLVATFITSSGATVKVGNTNQVSGTTPNNFTTSVTYTVTNGSVVNNYVVAIVPVAITCSNKIAGDVITLAGESYLVVENGSGTNGINNTAHLSGLEAGTVKFCTSKVTDMDGMFYGSANFNQDISNWDTSNVTDMANMFRDSMIFNQNISMWNTGAVNSSDCFGIDASITWLTHDPSWLPNFSNGTNLNLGC